MKKKVLLIFSVILMLSGCEKAANTKDSASSSNSGTASVAGSSVYSRIYITEPSVHVTRPPGAKPARLPDKGGGLTDKQFEYVMDNIAFIGDSVTSGFGGYQKVSMDKVFAITGVGPSNIRDHSFPYDGSEYAALTILSYTQPEYVVISMGLNDVNSYSPEEFSQVYMDFVDDAMAVCESTKFYIFSITPVAADCENISNDTINALNAQLQKTVSQHSGNIYYVDCNSALKGADGCMNEAYSGGDGIHFNGDAYDVMLAQLRKTIGGGSGSSADSIPTTANMETDLTEASVSDEAYYFSETDEESNSEDYQDYYEEDSSESSDDNYEDYNDEYYYDDEEY